MDKFRVGDVVKLKSGGIYMTVRCSDRNNAQKVYCDWYQKKKIETKAFYEDQLELVEYSKSSRSESAFGFTKKGSKIRVSVISPLR